MSIPELNHFAAWLGVLLGMISGAVIGLAFANDHWLGGYGSWPRRLVRLGHISFFGVALVNFAYALSWHDVIGPATAIGAGAGALAHVAGLAFVAAAGLMPLICFLAAWRKPFRHAFALPVVLLLAGVIFIVIILGGQL